MNLDAYKLAKQNDFSAVDYHNLIMDQGSSFISKEVRDFAESYKIKTLNSSPYYAQANVQAESSNKILIKLIKKKIEENPRRWHEVLSEAL